LSYNTHLAFGLNRPSSRLRCFDPHGRLTVRPHAFGLLNKPQLEQAQLPFFRLAFRSALTGHGPITDSCFHPR